MRCRFLISLAVIVIAASMPSLAQTPTRQNDWLIVPGQRAGPIQSNTTHADLIRIFGPANVRERDVDTGEVAEAATVIFPGQRDRTIAIFWETLGQAQVHALPPDSRRVVNQAYRKLRSFPPDPRQQVTQADEPSLSPPELEVLNHLLRAEPDFHGSKITNILFCYLNGWTVTKSPCLWHTTEGVTLGTTMTTLQTLNGAPFAIEPWGTDAGPGGIHWQGGKLAGAWGDDFGVRLSWQQPSKPTPAYNALVQEVGDHPTSTTRALQKLNPKVVRMGLAFTDPPATAEPQTHNH